MGFVAQPSGTIPPDDPADLVAGDDWYPAVSIAQFRDAYGIAKAVSDGRVRDALRAGMAYARRELRAWKAGHVADGVAKLEDVDDETIDGESAAVLLYARAVCSMAAADLAETHNDVSATAEGRDRNLEQVSAADQLRRDAVHAIRDILAEPRTAVELI